MRTLPKLESSENYLRDNMNLKTTSSFSEVTDTIFKVRTKRDYDQFQLTLTPADSVMFSTGMCVRLNCACKKLS